MNTKQLIKKIRKGDQEAFGLLVEELLPTAYRTAFFILKSKEYAEDAIQNALEGAYISIMKTDNDMNNFKAWFYSLVYSRSIDIYRKNNRHVHIDISSHREAELYMTTESAQELTIQRESKEEMVNQIMKLKREQSVPLYLHYYEELTVKEIALVLGENSNTIKTRMKRGKQKLASIIKESNKLIKEVKTYGF
ncbi:RNA polymerase sigma factor [Bacillus sp. BGMRC 2118]|nr:RNA polymerase sigma factor [Bacillus sp. BGMRC 2118]